MEDEIKQPNRCKAVERLCELIDQRNRLMLHISNLKTEYARHTDPHVKESIETLCEEFIQALKRTNKRITLLDESLKNWVE